MYGLEAARRVSYHKSFELENDALPMTHKLGAILCRTAATVLSAAQPRFALLALVSVFAGPLLWVGLTEGSLNPFLQGVHLSVDDRYSQSVAWDVRVPVFVTPLRLHAPHRLCSLELENSTEGINLLRQSSKTMSQLFGPCMVTRTKIMT